MAAPSRGVGTGEGRSGGTSAAAPATLVRAVVGLGNPGSKYAATRHNVGFMAVERLAARLGVNWSAKFNGLVGRGRLGDRELTLLQPQQFMNLSGFATQAMAQFYGIKPAEILVVHDDLDLPFGRIQLKVGGGHGGHNGLRSLQAQLGDSGFARLRIGIGRPEGGKGGEEAVSNWVLSPFSPLERAELDALLSRALVAIEDSVYKGAAAAMNAHNASPKPPKPSKPAEPVELQKAAKPPREGGEKPVDPSGILPKGPQAP